MRWRQGSAASSFVFRNLKAKFLKAEDLCGAMRRSWLALRTALSELDGHSELIVRQTREIIGKTTELFWPPAVGQALAGGSHWLCRLFLVWTRPGSIAFGV
jgi:hypothetical protein